MLVYCCLLLFVSCLQPPIAPKPRIMHLSVTGNTYSIPDYCRLYGSKFDSFCIDYNSIMTKTRPVEKQTIVDGELKLIVSDSEMSIITNTMAECLRLVAMVIITTFTRNIYFQRS